MEGKYNLILVDIITVIYMLFSAQTLSFKASGVSFSAASYGICFLSIISQASLQDVIITMMATK